ncbi:MAG: AbrB/MazE/SpoVT family DNA-binding domain-containing protein [Gemmatimonadota bacterium]|nr:AbrB/MazE/SpoVT family DNA-binding domain-containing protein [Gemmatimonadota bacterium]
MVKKTVIRSVGNSAGVVLPKAMLERLRLAGGDRVYVIEVENGVLLTPYDPDFAEAMTVYEDGARTYRNAMRELAR